MDGVQVTRSGTIQHLIMSRKEFSPKTEEYGEKRNPGEVLYRMSSAENGSRGRERSVTFVTHAETEKDKGWEQSHTAGSSETVGYLDKMISVVGEKQALTG